MVPFCRHAFYNETAPFYNSQLISWRSSVKGRVDLDLTHWNRDILVGRRAKTIKMYVNWFILGSWNSSLGISSLFLDTKVIHDFIEKHESIKRLIQQGKEVNNRCVRNKANVAKTSNCQCLIKKIGSLFFYLKRLTLVWSVPPLNLNSTRFSNHKGPKIGVKNNALPPLIMKNTYNQQKSQIKELFISFTWATWTGHVGHAW